MSIPLFLTMYLKALSIRPPLQPSLPSGPVHDNRTANSFVDIQTCIEQLLLTQSLCSGTCPYFQTQHSGPHEHYSVAYFDRIRAFQALYL